MKLAAYTLNHIQGTLIEHFYCENSNKQIASIGYYSN